MVRRDQLTSRIDLSSSAYQLPGENSGFGDEHSGQFNARIQHLQPFYDRLINTLGDRTAQSMKQKSWILAVGALMAFAVIWSLRTTSVMSRTVTPIAAGATSPRESLGAAQPSAEASPSARAEGHRDSVATAVLEMLGTPIAFYGRVVDQNNSPVADAAINYGALDKFGAAGSQYQGRSDAAGNFSIAGIRGAVLRVGVQKEGYYMIDGKSAGAFAYGIRSDSSSKDPPVADRPAVFVLQKDGSDRAVGQDQRLSPNRAGWLAYGN